MVKLIIMFFIIVSCQNKQEDRVCKTVAEIGGCNIDYCGVKFTDNTFTSGAVRPVVGMKMCQLSDRDYWVSETRFIQ